MRNGKSAERANGAMSATGGPLPPADQKAVYVRDMFGRIAWRYDLMNRLMTLGRDRAWRRYTVSQLGLEVEDADPKLVLDVATGTGDLALETLAQHPDASVFGLDFVPEMLILAQHKASAMEGNGQMEYPSGEAAQLADGSFALLAGDALRIPFPDGAFDGVVTGFALRNVTNIPAAFAEMARVTRRGGRIACLEIAKPQTPFFRRLFGLYFYRFVPLLGGWISGQPDAYTYLPHSLSAFLTPDELVDVMRQTGWRDASYRRLMLGTVAVHVGVRR
jgi:demethylmenaquinone methyltransferase/2-methoxy-6-polyprenyl-1,4-benzoquinol methylase